jgi:hypothetical protein
MHIVQPGRYLIFEHVEQIVDRPIESVSVSAQIADEFVLSTPNMSMSMPGSAAESVSFASVLMASIPTVASSSGLDQYLDLGDHGTYWPIRVSTAPPIEIHNDMLHMDIPARTPPCILGHGLIARTRSSSA